MDNKAPTFSTSHEAARCAADAAAYTLLVADDHPMFRAALSHNLRATLANVKIVEAASQRAVLRALAMEPAIDLVLLDLTMPDTLGFSSLVLLRKEHPHIPVLVISADDRPPTVWHARQFGAIGFLSKSSPMDIFRDAILRVLDGGSWFVADKVHGDAHDLALAARLALLTPQQLGVLMLLTEGLPNKQIAERLGIADNTVKIHVAAVLRKLRCRSRTQAALIGQSLATDSGQA
ncbi:DNA-binding response regulator [Dyella monticola]|uniref:DNA-binding response regulator n=1 Tax=Dyella monticola TaxID=1927958 RepID=A0A370WT62_9GAMM|nr:response regulator transcription factor [Dyella monticola]RDS79207.1 DNA-binding response regulator [Dyella monticola]